MWIDVNDDLPSGFDDVLAYNRYGCTVGHYDHMAGAWRDENDDLMEFEVTHWQPLPSAPSERKPKPQTARTCGDCKNWQDGSCNLPRSPRFTDTTSATDGCTPNKKARADWI